MLKENLLDKSCTLALLPINQIANSSLQNRTEKNNHISLKE